MINAKCYIKWILYTQQILVISFTFRHPRDNKKKKVTRLSSLNKISITLLVPSSASC